MVEPLHGELEVAALYQLMSPEQLRMLRTAFVLDAKDARERGDAEGVVFCSGRIELIEDELARR